MSACTVSEVTTDIPFRSVITLKVGDVGRKLVLVGLALHSREDGTGACVPDDLLAEKSSLTVTKLRRIIQWLIENGYVRQSDPGRPVYDVALSDDVRQEWRRSALPRTIPARHRPNGPCGSWVGNNPLSPGWAATPTPPPGMYVVYILFDDADVPCYVGCTDNFRIRIRAHVREKKPFAAWQAAEVFGWPEALNLETRTIDWLKPYLNVAKVTQ